MSATLEFSLNHDLIPAAKAIELVTGQRPHATTIYRWAHVGVRGNKLPTKVLFGKRVSTVEAAREFLEAISAERSA